MDFYNMPVTDAIKLLKHCGFEYLATSLEQAIAKLPSDQQVEQQEQQIDPFDAVIQGRGYKMPSNAR